MNATLPTLLVQDIMVTKVFRVTPEMKLWEVAELLIKKRISGSPVVDQNDHVLAVLGEGDTLRLAAEHGLEATVAECLPHLPPIKSIITLKKEAKFLEAYRLFLKHRVHRIPIVDGNGRLHGLLTRSQVLVLFVESHYGKKIERQPA